MDAYSPSLLDKLLGVGAGGGEGINPRMSLDQIKDSVARDIEMLLNAHAHIAPEIFEGLPHASKSVLNAGMVDISSLSMASDADRARIATTLKNALLHHDKRLKHIEVNVRQQARELVCLSFSIRATLVLHADMEPVTFDAVLQPGSNRYEVVKGDPRMMTQA